MGLRKYFELSGEGVGLEGIGGSEILQAMKVFQASQAGARQDLPTHSLTCLPQASTGSNSLAGRVVWRRIHSLGAWNSCRESLRGQTPIKTYSNPKAMTHKTWFKPQ